MDTKCWSEIPNGKDCFRELDRLADNVMMDLKEMVCGCGLDSSDSEKWSSFWQWY